MSSIKISLLLASLVTLLAACGQTPQSDTASTEQKPSTPVTALSPNRVIGPEGGEIRFGTVTLHAAPRAVLQTARVEIAKLPVPQNQLAIPAVNDINSRYLMGEVAQRKLIGVYRVQTDAQLNEGSLWLTLHLGGAQPQPNTVVEEVFAKDNATGEIRNIQFAQGQKDLDVGGVFSGNLDGSQPTDKTIYGL